MITIVDYGLGNILAFANVYRRLNVPVNVAKDAAGLAGASKLILPGVGAFDHAISQLQQSGMRAALDELVLGRKVPVLGICVGMQMLAYRSTEGHLPGLAWIPGIVKEFDVSRLPTRTHLPHMGWNDVIPAKTSPLFVGLESDARFYFLHSFYFECETKEHVVAEASYGGDFTCCVNKENIYGVQFHPEKSHHSGTRLLKNFADL
jgi:glutamine amidotransferase